MVYLVALVLFVAKLLATGFLLAIGFEVGRRTVIWYDARAILRNPLYQKYSGSPATA
jgi:hypothetical protein